MSDLVVVLPGIMGSTLVGDDGAEVWGLRAGTVVRGVLTAGRGVRRLELPAGIGDGPAGDGVTARRLLGDIHLIPGIWSINIGYRRLLRHLADRHGLLPDDPRTPERPGRLLAFPYDWRLSNRHNGRLLKERVEPLLARWREHDNDPDAKLLIIAHSMGGLLARWFLDREGGAAYTRKLITLGTPHRGAATAIIRLVNGVGGTFGHLSPDLTSMARSLPSLHQLLPAYACIDRGGRLSTIAEAGLPELAGEMVADAARFHAELDAAHARVAGYDLHPIVGVHQPTTSSVSIDGATAIPLRTIADPDGTAADERGDGTVPRFAARPTGLRGDSPVLHHIGDTHTALPGNNAVLDEIDGILTGTATERRGAPDQLGVTVPELTLVGEPLAVEVEALPSPGLLEVRLIHAVTGKTVASRRLNCASGRCTAAFGPQRPAAYRIVVGSRGSGGHLRSPVTAATIVLDPAEFASS